MEQLEVANEKLNNQLLEAQLDRVITSSIEMCICFISNTVPSREIWLTTTGRAISTELDSVEDFFEQRGKFLPLIYSLIGKTVESVNVDDTGKLSLKVGDSTIFISSDEESLEEVWSVTPDGYSPYQEYEWFVTYTDSEELLVK